MTAWGWRMKPSFGTLTGFSESLMRASSSRPTRVNNSELSRFPKISKVHIWKQPQLAHVLVFLPIGLKAAHYNVVH